MIEKERRRPRGEGSVYEVGGKGSGRWVASLDFGHRNRPRRYAKSQKAALVALAQLRRDRDRGAPADAQKQTVHQFLDVWLAEVAKPGVRPLTYQRYEHAVRTQIVPRLGHLKLTRLTAQDVQQALNALYAAGLGARSVGHVRAILRNALGQAERWGLVERNAAALATPPRVETPEVRPLDPIQALALLRAARGDRLEALYTVALALGLRQGEARGLKWEDVDLNAGTLRVTRALMRIGGEFELVEPKTARSRRTIPLPEPVTLALLAHRVRQRAEIETAGDLWDDRQLVFCTEQGGYLYGPTVTKRLQRLVAKTTYEDAGGVEHPLPRQRFHDLRHAAASLMLAQGVPLRTVMETLGHSQISTTANVYLHVMPELQRDAAGRMAEWLNTVGSTVGSTASN